MKNRIVRYGLPLGALALLVMLPFRGASQEELDPLIVAKDTHKVLYENKLVRVIEAKVPPGKMEPKHKHPHGVTIYLATYDLRQKTFPDNKVVNAHREFGTVVWSEATVHEIHNVGKTPMHSIRVELK